MRTLYWSIVIYHIFYIATGALDLYFRFDRDTEGRIPIGFNWPYATYSSLYFAEKVIFELCNWFFAHKYWVVSLTLRQALSDNDLTFSEIR